ncbi:MAG: hypothetical protein WC989_05705 [Micavibrio sp.]
MHSTEHAAMVKPFGLSRKLVHSGAVLVETKRLAGWPAGLVT